MYFRSIDRPPPGTQNSVPPPPPQGAIPPPPPRAETTIQRPTAKKTTDCFIKTIPTKTT